MPKPFAHLHTHTKFSILDGAAKIKPLFEACVERNITALAITDHGNMYGVQEFFKTANEFFDVDESGVKHLKVKPICGQEFYYVSDMKIQDRTKTRHLVLLAQNMEGYKNIIKLSSEAYLEGMFGGKPRIDMAHLKRRSAGLICLTACLAGELPHKLLEGKTDEAREFLAELVSMYGKDNVYVELQNHGIADQLRVNPLLVNIAKEFDLKCVATNDIHYVNREDAEAQEVMLCVQTGKKIDDPTHFKFENDEFYLKDYDEMDEKLGWCEEAMKTPLEIADKCEVLKFTKGKLLPNYIPPDGMTPAEYLRKLCYEGLKHRYGVITDEIRERAEMELGVIIKMGFPEYYLIVWDFIHAAQTKLDVPVGPGRGSGVGSIVAYAIGITQCNPLKYNLLFERFLNPERVSNPDFDVDFCFEGRSKVIEYVIEKYHASNVSQIITFGTMAAKQAIKDVARVYNMPLSDVDTMTKMISGLGTTIEDVLGRTKKTELAVKDFIDLYNNDPFSKKVIDMAIKLEGMPRQTGMHAAGVVICKDVVSDHVPLCRNGEEITTQYNKDEVEGLGLLKMDFLGLKTLTDIKKALQYVEETTGEKIDFEKCTYDDQKVFDKMASGDTAAIFQLESPGMSSFMQKLKPNSLEDVIAGISLYRPGPMDAIPTYIENKNNPDKIVYAHPLLKPILDVTYGVIIYQEQVMQIVRSLGGYTFGRADLLRRAMSKKKEKEMIKEKAIFIDGCPATETQSAVEGAVNRGVPREVADKLYDSILPFAAYAFNKSHATAYGYLAYQTAFLKTYYPIQLVVSIINNRIFDSKEIAKYLNHLKQRNVKIFVPDVNLSKVEFSCQNGGVRYGLNGVKGCGEAACRAIVDERNKNGLFKSFDDFLARCSSVINNKKMLENLIKGGGCDCFGKTRATLMASFERGMDTMKSVAKAKADGQMSLFDLMGDDGNNYIEPINYIEKPEFADKLRLTYEKEVLSVYVSGHPLSSYAKQYDAISFNTLKLEEITETDEDGVITLRKEFEDGGSNVNMAGMLTGVTRSYDKQGNEMYRAVLEDLYGSMELIIFNKATIKNKQYIVEDNMVKVSGRLSYRNNTPSVMVSRMSEWTLDEPKVESSDVKLYLRFPSMSDDLYEKVETIAKKYPGNSDVRICVDRQPYPLNKKVAINDQLMWELTGLLGKENVVKR